MRTILSLAMLCIYCGRLSAQEDTVAYEIFNSNSLEFAVMADGRLFHTPGGGGDLVSTVRDDGGSGLGFAGLWLTDLTPGESSQYAEHSKIDEENTFRPGIVHSHYEGAEVSEVIPMNKVWRVTRADILAHIADFGDDLQIDNPVPAAIMAWPGARNPHFAEYNNMPPLPEGIDYLAPFHDGNLDGIYNPMDGDYPMVPQLTLYPNLNIPDEIFWLSFVPNLYFYESVEVHLLGSLYYCEELYDEDSYTLNHTLSLDYYVFNDWFEDFESFTASLYLDFLPACGGGFVGSRPTKDMIYHYAPNYYQDCPDRRPNIVACRGLNKPSFINENNSFEQVGYDVLTRFLPEEETDGAHQQPPDHGGQIRNYAMGLWRTGELIRYGGDGYNVAVDADTVTSLFPGSPAIPYDWNASDANLPPGKRMGVISTPPIFFRRRTFEHFQYAIMLPVQSLSAPTLESSAHVFEEAFDEMDFTAEMLKGHPIWSINCPRINDTEETTSPGAADLILSPNPAGQQVRLEVEAGRCERYRIFNLQGQLVQERLAPQREETLDVSDWQSGVYIVQAVVEDGILVRQLLVE
ncbi:MAG: T9SS type A sorting domain-containing protein [Bacteroidetes bacterium]|jgi:hypothetical protein|nr:T9SS type A sorting domain-containing protein [Bacteroidota bacterium]